MCSPPPAGPKRKIKGRPISCFFAPAKRLTDQQSREYKGSPHDPQVSRPQASPASLTAGHWHIHDRPLSSASLKSNIYRTALWRIYQGPPDHDDRSPPPPQSGTRRRRTPKGRHDLPRQDTSPLGRLVMTLSRQAAQSLEPFFRKAYPSNAIQDSHPSGKRQNDKPLLRLHEAADRSAK